jgi:nicotinamidase-related amidase
MIGQRALLVVDVQRGFEDSALGPRENPHAEENVAKLIAAASTSRTSSRRS